MIRLSDEDRLQERKEGIAVGLQRGKREGKIETQWNTAKNLLKENMPLDLIARVTGLSEKELSTLWPQ